MMAWLQKASLFQAQRDGKNQHPYVRQCAAQYGGVDLGIMSVCL